MELEELKSAWHKVSSANEKNQLSEKEFKKLLHKRTIGITEKIGRNIRIGMAIILGWVLIGFTIDYVLSPVLKELLDKPYMTKQLMIGTFILESVNYLLIFCTIIIFWVRYKRLEKIETDSTNLRSKLQQLVNILSSYKRMFYVVLIIVIIYVVASFSSGFIMEYQYQIKEAGIDMSNMGFVSWLIVISSFLISIFVFVAVYYLLFNLFFKRLYGRYLKQLKSTLKELEEAV